MNNSLNRMDRDQMIFQIMVNTLYTEEALNKLPDEKIIELYQLKVEARYK